METQCNKLNFTWHLLFLFFKIFISFYFQRFGQALRSLFFRREGEERKILINELDPKTWDTFFQISSTIGI